MKKQKKKHLFKSLTALALIVAMAFAGTVCVYAVDIPPGAEDVAPAQPGDRAEAQAYPLTRDAGYFQYGESIIEYSGNYIMSVFSTTIATTIAKKVKATAILEQYKGGTWQVYDLYQEDELNSPMAEAYMSKKVPAGYYYRAHGIHIVVHNGTNTRRETITGLLWLDK